MKNKLLIIIIVLGIGLGIGNVACYAGMNRMYLGEENGRVMVGVETIMGYQDIYFGGEARIFIQRATEGAKGAVFGFVPQDAGYFLTLGGRQDKTGFEYTHYLGSTLDKSYDQVKAILRY
jgi:hypothetical protein